VTCRQLYGLFGKRIKFFLSGVSPIIGPQTRISFSQRLPFLGGFQTDSFDEIVQRLNHRSISTIEGGDLFFGNGLVCGKGLQNAGSQGCVDFFMELQEHQADLIAVGEKPVATGMRDLFHQALSAQLPEVITERSKLVLFRCHLECLQGLWI
jgi:hypothetical protein